jgi:hypothetical protein
VVSRRFSKASRDSPAASDKRGATLPIWKRPSRLSLTRFRSRRRRRRRHPPGPDRGHPKHRTRRVDGQFLSHLAGHRQPLPTKALGKSLGDETSRGARPPRFFGVGLLQSPFAQLGCYLRWGDVIRLLRGHYSSVFARTGSCAAPVGLSPPSAFGLVWRVLAGCYQSLLPTAASRRYLRQSVLGCWIPYPGGTRACFFHGAIGLPQRKSGSASRSYPV